MKKLVGLLLLVSFFSVITGCSEDGASADTGTEFTGEVKMGRVNYADAKTPLASKLDSSEYYREHMAEEAGATKTAEENYAGIEAYVTGKTVSELKKVLEANSPEEMVDVVSGATLVDTYGYVTTFVEAAKAAE